MLKIIMFSSCLALNGPEIRDILRTSIDGRWNDPLLQSKAIYGPTVVVGGPKLAKDVEELFTLAPFLRGRVKTVIAGYSEGWGEYTFRHGGGDAFYNDKNQVWGLWDEDRKEITINPRVWSIGVSECYVMQTLVHEFGHVVGIGHGELMDKLEGLVKQ